MRSRWSIRCCVTCRKDWDSTTRRFDCRCWHTFIGSLRDAAFVQSRRDLWRPSVDHILSSREKESGLLPKENYCGDIHTQVYSLNSNANCWRGLRDIAAVLRDMGETAEADPIAASANEFREKIQAALRKSIDPRQRPMFIPIALFGEEKPYEQLTDSKMGSYWDLMIPYVLGSEILTDEQTQGGARHPAHQGRNQHGNGPLSSALRAFRQRKRRG